MFKIFVRYLKIYKGILSIFLFFFLLLFFFIVYMSWFLNLNNTISNNSTHSELILTFFIVVFNSIYLAYRYLLELSVIILLADNFLINDIYYIICAILCDIDYFILSSIENLKLNINMNFLIFLNYKNFLISYLYTNFSLSLIIVLFLFFFIVLIRIATPRFKIESISKLGWLYIISIIIIAIILFFVGFYY